MDYNRRSFLHLVRNRIAAGVLCSGMLTDALEGMSLPKIIDIPGTITEKVHYVSSTFGLGFKITKEVMEDDSMYGTINKAMINAVMGDKIMVLPEKPDGL